MTAPKSVPREFYEEMKRRAEAAEGELKQYRARYGVLVDQMVSIKRAELGLAPPDFDPEKLDPLSALGEQTKAAIDEFSYGDPEQRNYLRNWALNEWASRKATGTPPDEIDTAVAARIREGDSG